MPLEIKGKASIDLKLSKYLDTVRINHTKAYRTGSSALKISQLNFNLGQIDNLKKNGITHVITGITYGGRYAFSFEHDYEKVVKELNVGGSLDISGTISAVVMKAKAKLDIEMKDNSEKKDNDFSYTGSFAGPSEYTEAGMKKYEEGFNAMVDQHQPHASDGKDRPERGAILTYNLTPIG